MAERTRDDALGRTVGIAGTPHRAAVPILTKVWAGPPDRARNGWHTLLANADVRGPSVLVGHSFGGLYAWMYAGVYPDPVAGMVLVDASHPDQWAYAPPEFKARVEPAAAMGLAYRAAQRVGVARLVSLFPIPAECGHPAPYCTQERAYRNARFIDAYVAEMGAPGRDA